MRERMITDRRCFFLPVIAFLFFLLATSCETDEDYYFENTHRLCLEDWVTTYSDYNSETNRYLFFEEDGTGIEVQEVFYYPLSSFPDRTYEFFFKWKWTYLNEIVIDYEDFGVIYFEKVNVGYDRLSGYLNGEFTTFYPSFY